jgi:hypothetical protein
MRCRRLHARTPCLLASATSLRKFGTMIGLETPKGDGSQTRPPVPVQKEIGVAGPGCPAGKQAASGVSLERTSLHSRHLRSPARFFVHGSRLPGLDVRVRTPPPTLVGFTADLRYRYREPSFYTPPSGPPAVRGTESIGATRPRRNGEGEYAFDNRGA